MNVLNHLADDCFVVSCCYSHTLTRILDFDLLISVTADALFWAITLKYIIGCVFLSIQTCTAGKGLFYLIRSLVEKEIFYRLFALLYLFGLLFGAYRDLDQRCGRR